MEKATLDNTIQNGAVKINKSTSLEVDKILALNEHIKKPELMGHILCLAMGQKSPFPQCQHIKLPIKNN